MSPLLLILIDISMTGADHWFGPVRLTSRTSQRPPGIRTATRYVCAYCLEALNEVEQGRLSDPDFGPHEKRRSDHCGTLAPLAVGSYGVIAQGLASHSPTRQDQRKKCKRE